MSKEKPKDARSALSDKCGKLIDAANAVLGTHWAKYNATGIDESEAVDDLTDQTAEAERALSAVKVLKQPVVVALLDDQDDLIDVVGLFDTDNQAQVWSNDNRADAESGTQFITCTVKTK